MRRTRSRKQSASSGSLSSLTRSSPSSRSSSVAVSSSSEGSQKRYRDRLRFENVSNASTEEEEQNVLSLLSALSKKRAPESFSPTQLQRSGTSSSLLTASVSSSSACSSSSSTRTRHRFSFSTGSHLMPERPSSLLSTSQALDNALSNVMPSSLPSSLVSPPGFTAALHDPAQEFQPPVAPEATGTATTHSSGVRRPALQSQRRFSSQDVGALYYALQESSAAAATTTTTNFQNATAATRVDDSLRDSAQLSQETSSPATGKRRCLRQQPSWPISSSLPSDMDDDFGSQQASAPFPGSPIRAGAVGEAQPTPASPLLEWSSPKSSIAARSWAVSLSGQPACLDGWTDAKHVEAEEEQDEPEEEEEEEEVRAEYRILAKRRLHEPATESRKRTRCEPPPAPNACLSALDTGPQQERGCHQAPSDPRRSTVQENTGMSTSTKSEKTTEKNDKSKKNEKSKSTKKEKSKQSKRKKKEKSHSKRKENSKDHEMVKSRKKSKGKKSKEKEESKNTEKEKSRYRYRCGVCGEMKRGHVCNGTNSPSPPRVVAEQASVQAASSKLDQLVNALNQTIDCFDHGIGWPHEEMFSADLHRWRATAQHFRQELELFLVQLRRPSSTARPTMTAAYTSSSSSSEIGTPTTTSANTSSSSSSNITFLISPSSTTQ